MKANILFHRKLRVNRFFAMNSFSCREYVNEKRGFVNQFCLDVSKRCLYSVNIALSCPSIFSPLPFSLISLILFSKLKWQGNYNLSFCPDSSLSIKLKGSFFKKIFSFIREIFDVSLILTFQSKDLFESLKYLNNI